MAIYHCSIKIGSRSKGQSAIHAAAYRSGERLEDQYDGTIADYTHKRGIVHSEIVMPEVVRSAHPEFANRESLWNAVERLENKPNSRLFREFECALPKELNRDQRIEVAREFVGGLVDQGMIVDWSMHEPGTGTQNYHIHAMATCRACDPETGEWISGAKTRYAEDQDGNKIPVIDPETGEQKVRIRKGKGVEKLWVRESAPGSGWDTRENMGVWRQAWEDAVNHGLAMAGIEERVSRLSLEAQGIDRIPQIHVGVAAGEIASKQESGTQISFSNNGDTDSSIIAGFKRLRDHLERLMPVFKNPNGMISKLESAMRKLINRCSSVIKRAERTGITRRDVNELIKSQNRAAALIDARVTELQIELSEIQEHQERDRMQEAKIYERLERLSAARESGIGRAPDDAAGRDASRDRGNEIRTVDNAISDRRPKEPDRTIAEETDGISKGSNQNHHRRK